MKFVDDDDDFFRCCVEISLTYLFMLCLPQIAKIREDVDYYVSSCRESDFEENEELYDDLKLEEASAALGSRLAAMNHDNDDHSSDVSSEAPSLQNSAGSVSPSPSLAHSKVITFLVSSSAENYVM